MGVACNTKCIHHSCKQWLSSLALALASLLPHACLPPSWLPLASRLYRACYKRLTSRYKRTLVTRLYRL